MFSDSFLRREVDGVPYYSCRALEAVPSLRHGFSSRRGGVSLPPAGALNLGHVSWDTRERVEENRRRLLGAVGLDPSTLRTLAQVHSDCIHIIKDGERERNGRPEADAAATATRGIALAIQVADCFPVLLADPRGGAIAAVHAGWRGTVARIARKTVETLAQRFGAQPPRIVAAIGPGIRSCCFEAGPEVAEAYARAFPGRDLTRPRAGIPEKYLIDLPRAIALQLDEAGLEPTNVHDLGACTLCNPAEFFSYRGEGARAGRLMGVIGWTA